MPACLYALYRTVPYLYIYPSSSGAGLTAAQGPTHTLKPRACPWRAGARPPPKAWKRRSGDAARSFRPARSAICERSLMCRGALACKQVAAPIPRFNHALTAGIFVFWLRLRCTSTLTSHNGVFRADLVAAEFQRSAIRARAVQPAGWQQTYQDRHETERRWSRYVSGHPGFLDGVRGEKKRAAAGSPGGEAGRPV